MDSVFWIGAQALFHHDNYLLMDDVWFRKVTKTGTFWQQSAFPLLIGDVLGGTPRGRQQCRLVALGAAASLLKRCHSKDALRVHAMKQVGFSNSASCG